MKPNKLRSNKLQENKLQENKFRGSKLTATKLEVNKLPAHSLDSKSTKRTSSGASPRSSLELNELNLGAAQTDYVGMTRGGYTPDLLESFQNKNPNSIAWTSLICTEFTSLCPKTGQPDFARIFINYIADKKMVESKSLKLYLFSFRNHGDFHEDCVQTICDDLFDLLKPRYIEVMGEFTPRGGISIFPYASRSNGEKIFQQIKTERLSQYAPGKWSMPLSKIYGGQ